MHGFLWMWKPLLFISFSNTHIVVGTEAKNHVGLAPLNDACGSRIVATTIVMSVSLAALPVFDVLSLTGESLIIYSIRHVKILEQPDSIVLIMMHTQQSLALSIAWKNSYVTRDETRPKGKRWTLRIHFQHKEKDLIRMCIIWHNADTRRMKCPH